jgi:hypothetical protein
MEYFSKVKAWGLKNNGIFLMTISTTESDLNRAKIKIKKLLSRFKNVRKFKILDCRSQPFFLLRYSVFVEVTYANNFQKTVKILTKAENNVEAESIASEVIEGFENLKSFKITHAQLI